MSLNGALQIGRSGLAVSQAGLQVAGNNMANAATPGFHRRTIHLQPMSTEVVGPNARVGRGVQILSIRREIDYGLAARYRDSLSNQHSALIDQRFLTAVETLQNELTGNDLSSTLSQFFNAFSELANNPEDNAVRSLAIQQGVTLSGRIQDMRRDYATVIGEIDREISDTVRNVNRLLDQIASINAKIVSTEAGAAEESSLRDQRDLIVDELSKYLEVDVIEHSNGGADVLVNSIPIVLAGGSRGVEVRVRSEGDLTRIDLRVSADGTILEVNSGRLGGLLRQRDQTVKPVINQLDTFAGQLINQVNRLHSQGQGKQGASSITGTYINNDTTANLNASAAGLPFKIDNGSFMLHVTNTQTGLRTTHQINVNGNADSLNDLIARINGTAGNVTAGLGLGNMLTLNAAVGYEISFSDDSSGALAGLGVNTFFSGHNASDIAVRQELRSNPSLLAADGGHQRGSGTNAVSIANLQDTAIGALGGATMREYWQNAVNELAVKANAANAAVETTQLVSESLDAQRQAVSGVSLDEEAINLMMFQRQYQAAARYITVIDEMLQTLLSIA